MCAIREFTIMMLLTARNNRKFKGISVNFWRVSLYCNVDKDKTHSQKQSFSICIEMVHHVSTDVDMKQVPLKQIPIYGTFQRGKNNLNGTGMGKAGFSNLLFFEMHHYIHYYNFKSCLHSSIKIDLSANKKTR